MYDELVAWLRSWSELLAHCERYESCAECDKQYICATFTNERIITKAGEAADAIEELSKLNAEITKRELKLRMEKPRWIPVTERLPEGDNRILVCSKLRDGQYWQSVCRFANNLHEVDEYDFPNERRPGFYYYDDEYGWIEKTGVTHWMPLPSTEGLNET